MSETATEPAPRPVLADYPRAWPFFSAAAVGAFAGILWFPAWFVTAQLLRIWAPRGGMAWLRARGVPEYSDERYASAMSWGPMIAIALRIAFSFDWLQPFEVIASRRKDPVPGSEWTVVLDIVLGVAIAAALTGVLTTRGRPRLLALAGFGSVAGLALVVAFRPPFQINGFAAIPLAALGGLTSQLAVFFSNAPQRRARRAARRAAQVEDERLDAEARKQRGY